MNRNNIKKILLSLPPIGILLAYFFLNSAPLVIVSPETGFDSTRFRVQVITDEHSGGHSSIVLLNEPANTLSYRYVLDNTLGEPIARVLIQSSQEKSIDLSPYNTLSITLRSEKGKRIPFLLCNPIHIHSTPQELRTYHLLVNYADADSSLKKYALHFHDFATPDWWYAFASNQDHQNQKQHIVKAQYLVLSNSTFTGNKNEDTVTVSDLRLVYDFSGFFIWCGLLSLVYYLAYVMVFYFPKNIGAETIYLLYKKIDTVNYEESDKQTVLAGIQQNFKNPELTVSDIQKETGIHERKISVILKKHTQLTFKQYVNQLRIEHAKKLLVETTLSVSDIAYECGYNNVSHFNRVFKSEEACSPQEYRQHKTHAN
jgi:AraC-like DNA-binding protein